MVIKNNFKFGLYFILLVVVILMIQSGSVFSQDEDYQSFLNFSKKYNQPVPESNDLENPVRYTVLALDVSSSLKGEPFEKMKLTAKRFCQEMLQANGSNYIAITTYTGYTVMKTNFTDVYEYLESAIDSMVYYQEGTNIEAGLSSSKDILDAVSYTGKTIKNVVIMTDGLPTHGTFKKQGIFAQSESSVFDTENTLGSPDSYAYANGAVDYSMKNLWNSANVYSFGFFHSIIGDELAFGRKLINALQNAGVYEVTDPDSLEFEFGEMTHDIIERPNDYPIIIVPGIMGSNLYTDPNDGQGVKVWAAKLENLSPLPETDILGEKDENGNLKPLYPHYNYVNLNTIENIAEFDLDANGTLTNLAVALSKRFPGRQIYCFSYDFRQSNVDTAELFCNYMREIKAKSGKEKVDIIAHSMGGLVVSQAVSHHRDLLDIINKIITCGTPYEGASALIDRAMTDRTLRNDKEGTFQTILGDYLLYFYGLSKEIKQSYASVSELVPTELYNQGQDVQWKFAEFYASVYPEKKDNLTSLDGATIKTYSILLEEQERLSQSEFDEICRAIFGENYVNAKNFHQELKEDGMNYLASLDNTYFIVGKNHKTIKDGVFSQVKYSKLYNIILNCITYNEEARAGHSQNLSRIGTLSDVYTGDGKVLLNDMDLQALKNIYALMVQHQDEYVLVDVDYEQKGDGTVPYYSATMGAGLKDSLSGIYDENNNLRYIEFSVDHGGTIKNNKAISHILSVLSFNIDEVNSDYDNSQGFVKVRIACPVEVRVEYDGDYLDSSYDNMSLLSSFGRLDYGGLEGDIKFMCLDDAEFSVKLVGMDDGAMDLGLEWYDENDQLTTWKQFVQIPVSSSSKLEVKTNKDGVTVLNVDNDGNGSIDKKWYAEADEIGYQLMVDDEQEGHNTMTFFRLGDDKGFLPRTGFSAVHPQRIAEKPLNISYKPLAWTIEIPSVNSSSEIVEVPFIDGEYPVTWLGDSVGLLEGSALPGSGQTVLIGHNHLNNTAAGPFAYLVWLEEGSRIFVHDPWNNIQAFVVYANEKVSETDVAAIEKLSNAYDNSLTMITCEDERVDGGYASRRVVSARLIEF